MGDVDTFVHQQYRDREHQRERETSETLELEHTVSSRGVGLTCKYVYIFIGLLSIYLPLDAVVHPQPTNQLLAAMRCLLSA